MSADVKEHTTVTITEEIVDRYDPCTSGKVQALEKGVLPCTLSTDPDENVDLALQVAQLVGVPERDADTWLCSVHKRDADCTGCRVSATGYRIEWLAKMLDALDVDTDDWALHWPRDSSAYFDLVSRLAQCFAWVADVLATQEGR